MWYSRDSLCYGVGARMIYIMQKCKKKKYSERRSYALWEVFKLGEGRIAAKKKERREKGEETGGRKTKEKRGKKRRKRAALGPLLRVLY